jgi:hypothetical protein
MAARQAASEALQRSEAVLLAAGLLEQLRGNPEAYRVIGFNELGQIVPPDRDCAEQSCTSAEWGAWSLWYWLQALLGSAATDEKDRPVAGLIAPQACLRAGPVLAVLKLSWQAEPTGEQRSCKEGSTGSGVHLLSLEARLEDLER